MKWGGREEVEFRKVGFLDCLGHCLWGCVVSIAVFWTGWRGELEMYHLWKLGFVAFETAYECLVKTGLPFTGFLAEVTYFC
jgi:hypothetical protein